MMRKLAPLVTTLALLGCGGSRAAVTPAANVSPNTPRDVFIARARLSDPNALFQAVRQAAPSGFEPIPETRNLPFPGVPFQTVRAYTLHYADRLVPPDDCDVVAADGTLCPGVNAPGGELAPERVAELLALVRAAANPNPECGRSGRCPLLRCADGPHLSFVFFDSGSRPVAKLEVELDDCNWWEETPAAPGLYSRTMSPSQIAVIARLCREAGLLGCYWDDAPLVHELALVERDAGALAAAEREADEVAGLASRLRAIDFRRRSRDATPSERRTLCANTLVSHGWHSEGAGFRCDGDAGAWTVAPIEACVAAFPACDVPMSEIAAWQDGVLRPGGRCVPPVSQAIERCSWGIRPVSLDAR